MAGVWAGFASATLGLFWSYSAAAQSAGTALRFTGTGVATVTAFGTNAPANEITIEFWFLPDTNQTQYVVALSPDQSTNRIAIAGPLSDGKMQWDFGDTNVGRLTYAAPGFISGPWQHLAFVSSQSANEMRVYRNGALQTNKTGVSSFAPGSYSLLLGGLSGTNFFRGVIDELRIWSLARTGAQISNYHHRPFLLQTTPGLFAYYRFDDGMGTTFQDSSTNNLDGARGLATFAGSSAPLGTVSATTLSATNIGLTNATFQGTVTPSYWPATVWFAYGPVGSLTNSTPVQNFGTNLAATNISVTVSNLKPGFYEFRIIASNVIDVVEGGLKSFQTPSLSSSGLSFPGIADGVTLWGDYDNDGFLDILISGMTSTGAISRIYHNNGNGTFTYAISNLTAMAAGSAAWGDYDKDGDLDLVMVGVDRLGLRFADIFRNDSGTFVSTRPPIVAMSAASVAWGDYDNDGDLDVLVAGTTNGLPSGAASQIYRNEAGTFIDARVNLVGIYGGSATWIDYNNDSYLDLLLTGSASGNGTNTLLYRNEKNGTFTNAIRTLQPLTNVFAAWGDFNSTGDDDPDLLLAGSTNVSSIRPSTSVYINGGSSFSRYAASLPNVYGGAAAWGDFNNDGEMELLLTGNTSTGVVASVYLGDSSVPGGFVETGDTLQEVWHSSVAWGDYDNDGDLDLFLAGERVFPVGNVALLYRNLTAVSNAPPSAPGLLLPPTFQSVGTNGATVAVGWLAATDALSSNYFLTYNMRVGTTPGGYDVMAPQSDLVTGKRLLPAWGNQEHGTVAVLARLNPLQTYYWSVQAIDAGYVGGPWSAEGMFHFLAGATVTNVSELDRSHAMLPAQANSYGLDAWAWFEWGPAGITLAPPQSLGNGTNTVDFTASVDLTGLAVNSQVFYRVVVSNLLGHVIYGEYASFRVPNSSVSVGAITNGLASGQFNACTLTLTNLGTNTATFTYTFEDGTPSWVGVNGPATLTVGGTAAVALVFNAVGLADGVYQTVLIIDSGPTVPETRVPIVLRVGDAYFAKPGDLNRDGVVNLFELNTIIQYYRGLLP